MKLPSLDTSITFVDRLILPSCALSVAGLVGWLSGYSSFALAMSVALSMTLVVMSSMAMHNKRLLLDNETLLDFLREDQQELEDLTNMFLAYVENIQEVIDRGTLNGQPTTVLTKKDDLH